MVYKHGSFLKKKDELEHMSLVHNMLVKNFCIKLHTLASAVTALKTILIYVYGCEKRNPKHTFTDWMKISSEKLNFINLDKYPICRAVVRPRAEIALFEP